MKPYKQILTSGLFLFLMSGCLTPFEPEYMAGSNNILVVEGMIIDPEGTVIKLSRSKAPNATVEGYEYIDNATVTVLCSDGTSIPLELNWNEYGYGNGEYVPTSEIHFKEGAAYAVDIRIDGKQYQSDFIVPLRTPEIDEINYITKDDGKQIDLRVSTHDPENKIRYYRWAYEENWEIKTEIFATAMFEPEYQNIITGLNLETSNNIHHCWGKESSTDFLLGNTTHITNGIIKDRVLLQRKLKWRDTRFSYLYCFTVKQYALQKEAYSYFENLQKNVEESGSLFAPLPTEMNSNIKCITNPKEAVIGYITASTESLSRLYIPAADVSNMTEPESCSAYLEYHESESAIAYHNGMGIMSPAGTGGSYIWRPIRCVDCRVHNLATKDKPGFWPNDHL